MPSRSCSTRTSTSRSSTSIASPLPRSPSPATDPARGAIGAALGYPGGGALTILPAAVSAHFAATGLDIYGVSKVRREVLELRAEIDRGDSGGPLILTDGTVGGVVSPSRGPVGGVVFAEARTDPDVGYALAATGGRAHQPGLGRTTAVDTGDCVADH